MPETYAVAAPEQPSFIRRAAIISAAMLTLVSACETAHSGSPTPKASFAQQLPATNLTECPAPTEVSLATAKVLEQTPVDPYGKIAEQIAKADRQQDINADIQQQHKLHPGLDLAALTNLAYVEFNSSVQNYSLTETSAWLTRDHAAKEAGVTIDDPRPYVDKLEWDLHNDPSVPFSEYFAEARAYLKLLGVTVEFPADDPTLPPLSQNMKSPTMADLNNNTAKQNAVSLIEAYASMPEQYVELAGLKKFFIAETADPTKEFGHPAFALVDGKSHGIVMNFSADDDLQLIYHETFHDVASSVCGGKAGMYNDPAFSQYIAYPYTSKNNGLSEADFWAQESSSGTLSQVTEDIADNKAAEANQLVTQIDKKLKQISYVTDYSEGNVAECQAETGRAMSSGDWGEVLDSRTPLISEEFTVLLARIVRYEPGVARYFALTSAKGAPNYY